jgi:hypothetical protein
MQRSGGDSGRPLRHLSIEAIERHVAKIGSDPDELKVVWFELLGRKSKRAVELKDLVARLIRNSTGVVPPS